MSGQPHLVRDELHKVLVERVPRALACWSAAEGPGRRSPARRQKRIQLYFYPKRVWMSRKMDERFIENGARTAPLSGILSGYLFLCPVCCSVLFPASIIFELDVSPKRGCALIMSQPGPSGKPFFRFCFIIRALELQRLAIVGMRTRRNRKLISHEGWIVTP